MKNPLLVPEFREMIASNNIEDIVDFCNTTPPSVAADFIGALSARENRDILKRVSPEVRSNIFNYYDDDVKLALISLFENSDLVRMIAGMLDAERLKLIRLLPISKQREIKANARHVEGKEALELIDNIEQILKSEAPEEEKLSAEEIASEILPLMQIYRQSDHVITKIDRVGKDCWINIVNPDKDAMPLLAQHFGVPLDFITASLDIDETARIEIEGNATLIIIKVPYFDGQNLDTPYYTLPIGIILINNMLVTICSKTDSILQDFIGGKVKNIFTVSDVRFILHLILRATMLYLQYLKQINNAANMIQKKLEQESKNRQLIKLMNFEKSLVYFTTSLRTNELMLERLQKHSLVNMDNDMENLFEDIVIETRQALEMANIYSDILSGMMDAFASVISNNLNITIKFLTSMTIIFTIPGTVAAFYGMNVKLPFQNHPMGFAIVVLTCLVLTILAVFFFIKKKWL